MIQNVSRRLDEWIIPFQSQTLKFLMFENVKTKSSFSTASIASVWNTT